MRKICLLLTYIISLMLVLFLTSCNKEIKQDESPLSMYIGLGNNNRGYLEELHELVLENTGIDLLYVYSNTNDTSNSAINMIKNNDLPADIMVTASSTPKDIQKNAFLDLTEHSNITDLFITTKIKECSINGSVYQLPFTSRLIGIEYNKTLFDEMNWEVPSTYEEMLELKEISEKAGYLFAVSAADATGHGFNYLFHIMGTDFICTPDGSEWFHNFQNGIRSIALFSKNSEYFKKYADNGLFGLIYNENWNASKKFAETRALFYYNIINNIYSYKGFRYNVDGTLYGATYEDNNIVLNEDENGNAVLISGKYVLYDENNKEHQGLKRYTIPGTVVIDDTYESMPWISENGSSNSFTAYDNCHIALNKSLGDPDKKDKLDKAIKVLEFMTTKPCTDLFSSLYKDGYISTNNYEIGEDRLYYNFKNQVSRGYLIPWYYNYFDVDSIVFVGDLLNKYLLKDESVTFNDILNELDLRNNNHLKGLTETIAEFDESLSFEDSAKIIAISNALSLQNKLSSNNKDNVVEVSLVPYTQDFKNLPLYTSIGVQQSKFYQGKLDKSLINSYISSKLSSPKAFILTGKEISTLLKNGFNPVINENNYHFNYACVTKENTKIDENKTYVVSIPEQCLDESILKEFKENSKIIDNINGSTSEGLELFFKTNSKINKNNIYWN